MYILYIHIHICIQILLLGYLNILYLSLNHGKPITGLYVCTLYRAGVWMMYNAYIPVKEPTHISLQNGANLDNFLKIKALNLNGFSNDYAKSREVPLHDNAKSREVPIHDNAKSRQVPLAESAKSR